MDMVYCDVYLQIPSLPFVSYSVIDKRTRGERGDCTLGYFGGHLGTQDVGCWGAAVQCDGKEAACLGNTGSLLAAAVFSLSLCSKEILLFSL